MHALSYTATAIAKMFFTTATAKWDPKLIRKLEFGAWGGVNGKRTDANVSERQETGCLVVVLVVLTVYIVLLVEASSSSSSS